MPQALQVIGLVAGFAGMSAAQDQASKAEEASRQAAAAQKEAIAAREAQAKLAERRERRKAIRNRIRTTAELKAQIDAAGAGGGSLVGGAVSSVVSQTGANLGFSTQMSGLGSRFSAASARAADANMMAGIYQSRSQAAGAMSGMGFKLFSSFGGTDFGPGSTNTSIFSGLFNTA